MVVLSCSAFGWMEAGKLPAGHATWKQVMQMHEALAMQA